MASKEEWDGVPREDLGKDQGVSSLEETEK